MTTKLQNAHKKYPMVVKYSKWPEYITTFYIKNSSKIYPNRDFWSEKKPSGNPDQGSTFTKLHFDQKL
jgi:hypothetical protein